ncbi:MAG: hypothetical protein MN733_39225 [Nitrososphaera sp.]|nr:hypothetical protein [Nitrososphaera sp.]
MDNANGHRKCRAYSSLNGGQTWTDEGFLSLSAGTVISNDPVVATNADGDFFIVCLAVSPEIPNPQTSDILYWQSSDGGSTWSGPNTVIHDTGGLVLNDKPWIAGDKGGLGNVYVCWTEYDRTPSPDTSKIKFRKIWPSLGSLKTLATGNTGTADPGTGEVQFCQVAVGPSGIIYVTWQRLVTQGTGPDLVGGTAKIQLKRSFDGGSTFETPSQPVKTFTRFPQEYQSTCPEAPGKIWGCLKGEAGVGIDAPAIHTITVDTGGDLHIAYSDWDSVTLADIKYIVSTDCETQGSTCTWSSPKKIVKDGNLAVDQWDPAISVSPDTRTIHVKALDRRNDVDNINWRPWHYHCHYGSSDCTTTAANWAVTGITDQDSWNFDSETFIGHYNGIASSAAREANALWVDTRLHLGQQDYNIFTDWTT